MHYSDRSQLGWLILRHHDPLVDADLRNVPGALHQVGYDDEGKPAMEAPGDLSGGAVWRAKPGERFDMAAHFLTGAPVTATPASGATGSGGNWSLLRAIDTPDTRLEAKNLGSPAWAKGTFPKGHTGQASAAVEESTQIDLLHPDFWGLYSPQRNGPSSAGTYVYDLRDDGSPDPVRSFQLQQFVRVGDLGAGLCGFSGKVPALQLGVEDLDVRAGGLPFAEGRNLGLGSWLAGGPFTVGVGLCQHAKAGPDGHMSPLHLATESLFLGAHDGPLDFRGQIDVGTADQDGVWQRVHLDWDPEVSHIAGCGGGFGKWRWRVRIPHFVGDPGGDRRKKEVIEDGFERIRRGEDRERYVLIDYLERVDERERFAEISPFKQVAGVISDGAKRTESTSPYVQTAPGFVFKPQFPALGATHAYDAVAEWFSGSPQVAQLVAFGDQSGTEFAITDGTDYSHPTGQGGFAILPGDVDPFAVFRGETVTSDYTPQIVIPNGLAQLGFGTVGTNGLTQSGMVVEVGTGGRLDFKTVDSTGAVTATAYIPSGASGDISGAAGSGDVTGPASSTDTELAIFSGTGGKTITGGTGITVSSGVPANVNGVRFTPALSSVPAALSSGYGIYMSNEGVGGSEDLMLNRAGTVTEVPSVDTSGSSADQVLAINGTNNGWTLVNKSSLAGALNDLSDVTISSAAQYEYLTHNGSGWVNQDYADFRATAAGGGYTNVVHRIQDNVSLGTGTTQTMHDALVVSAPSNYSATYTGGTGILFEGYNGQDLGDIGFVRTGASTARFAIRTVLGSGISPDVWVRNESSITSMAITGTGVLALKDTGTGATKYGPWGTGYGHVYVIDGQLHYTDDTNTRHTITGSATVQADLNNADNVSTATTSNGEILVYNGSTFAAQDKDTQSGAGGSSRVAKTATTTLTATAAAASVTASGLIPGNVRVIAVTTVITTSLGTTNGTSGYRVGDGSTANRWGTGTGAVTAGTNTGPADYGTTADRCCFWGSAPATDVVITADGGNFDGTGAFRIVVFYEEINEPTS